MRKLGKSGFAKQVVSGSLYTCYPFSLFAWNSDSEMIFYQCHVNLEVIVVNAPIFLKIIFHTYESSQVRIYFCLAHDRVAGRSFLYLHGGF